MESIITRAGAGTVTVDFDSNSINNYVDKDGNTSLTINVVIPVDNGGNLIQIPVGIDSETQIDHYASLSINSKTIKMLNIVFQKKDVGTGVVTTVQTYSNIGYGFVDIRTIVFVFNREKNEYSYVFTSGGEFTADGDLHIKDVVDEAITEAFPEVETGNDPDGIPGSAAKASYDISLSGWLCHSLGVVDDGVSSGRSIAIEINIGMNNASTTDLNFNSEVLFYPYKTGTTEEDFAKAPLAWSLFQPKTGLTYMPLAPGDNKFTDYSNLTANKPLLPTINNNTGDYLLAGRFNGANTIATAPVKDKMNLHSQGALVLHIVFSVITPRTLYFKINNPYAPFVKILFYSFQIQSFYNGSLRCFYAPLYKNVVFKQTSLDIKGLQISTAPTATGAAKKCPIQNIYQWSKFNSFENVGESRAATPMIHRQYSNAVSILSANDLDQLEIELEENIEEFGPIVSSQDVVRRYETKKAYVGPRDCDFRYITGESIFPMAGTLPVLKANTYKQFLPLANENSVIDGASTLAPAFILSDKKVIVGTKAELTVEQKDAIFEVVDKDKLPITSVFDFSAANMSKIAITVNSNLIWVIGKDFAKKITDGLFKSFDLMFNERQHWLTFVIKRNSFTAGNIKSLQDMFIQFGAATTASQKLIAEEFSKFVPTADMEISFRFNCSNAAARTAVLKPTTLAVLTVPAVTTGWGNAVLPVTAGEQFKEFEISVLSTEFAGKLTAIKALP